jgi:hypothetical protein
VPSLRQGLLITPPQGHNDRNNPFGPVVKSKTFAIDGIGTVANTIDGSTPGRF